MSGAEQVALTLGVILLVVGFSAFVLWVALGGGGK
jgi:hypothetical protein